jgi:hypothetical protein
MCGIGGNRDLRLQAVGARHVLNLAAGKRPAALERLDLPGVDPSGDRSGERENRHGLQHQAWPTPASASANKCVADCEQPVRRPHAD